MMEALGVIVEYNPFHNGHLYHLQQSKNLTNPDVVIAVMSGQFLQRGEPALVSKWERTKMALLNGIDIVVELPYAFATQKAEVFATGAVSILSELRVDSFCFGSEQGNIEDFNRTVQLMGEKSDPYHSSVQKYIKEGNSYPKASSLAFSETFQNENVIDLTQPNNILGFHYVKAVLELGSPIQPFTIGRTTAGYHDEQLYPSNIASATAIRKHLFETNREIQHVQDYVPAPTFSVLQQIKSFHRWEDYYSLLKYKILCSTPEQLRTFYEVEEGIEYRLQECMKKSKTFQEFMTMLKTKRYTWTRLQRMCTHILTNTTKDEMKRVTEKKEYSYVRLLGMSKAGQHYLREIKKDITIPIISNVASFSDDGLALDKKATIAYSIPLSEPERSAFIHKEFSQPPIRFDEELRKFV
ncbi:MULTISPECIES: nucleotidyltransferase [Sutcliffiella]